MNNNIYDSLHDYLDAIMADKETECVEFKHGKGGFPTKGVKETYSSFANTEGGVIVIGIKEKDGNFYPEGLTEEKIYEYEKVFWDTVNDSAQVSRNILTNNDLIKGEYNGNHFIIVSVPRASREERPIYIGQNPLRGTYRRNASGDYLCKEWEVALMLQERSPDLAMDYEIQEGFDINDIDIESLRAYRQLFVNLRPTHAWSSDDNTTFLTHLKAYRKDRKTGKEGLTLSGLLMFGKYDSIIDALPQYMIDYREYTPGQERWSDRICSDGSWEANLFQSYRRILPKLQSFLPTPFKLEGNVRQDETKAHKGLREAFVNFLVHSLYRSDTKLIIQKHPTEIMFSNPGTMLVSKEQYYSGGYSICRNPSLQTMFMFIGVAEKAGSGSDTIIQGWKEANFRMPIISEKGEPNRVELVLPLESILSKEVEHKLYLLYGERSKRLSPNELLTMAMAVTMPHVSNSILQHSLDLHPADITNLLRGLCKEGLLISSGFGRGTIYSINTNFQYVKKHKDTDKFTHLEEVSEDNDLGGLFTSNIASNVASNIASNVASNIASNVASNIASNIASNVASNIASNHRKRRDYRELCSLIKDFCKTWKTRQEIAIALGYKQDYLRNNVLPRMVADGYLEKLDKDSATSPSQKYKATQKKIYV